MEYVATFEKWDNSIGVYVFFNCESEKNTADETGKFQMIKQEHLHLLERYNYPFDKYPNVNFIFDSQENVVKNYEGSYFLY
ncbi:hypothetical protein [Paenibacillus rigui]|uniref:Uncharacterized protein n=1 Tax=Paenibacillus rigui TaxID=554312 RepID=A0A229UNR2_9BACL|nr:hypothetical protein [Paenibacillus rigui]OXM84983.1 hypothetical protein CF651_17335 [Paenibacillus rigui]